MAFKAPYQILQELETGVIQGAELYARARHPLPRCHPGTRTSLIDEIARWTSWKLEEDYDLLWVHGLAGVGETVVAQSIGDAAERLVPSVRLAATFLFSRPRNHKDPSAFWISICHQIARSGAESMGSINSQLQANPTVLEADIRIQFEEFIRPVLSGFRVKHLIITDGLDECHGEQEKCQIIESLCNLIRLGILEVRYNEAAHRLLANFDWSGKDGESRYPVTLNPMEVDKAWAEGVLPDGIMHKVHDLWQLDKLKHLCNGSSIQL